MFESYDILRLNSAALMLEICTETAQLIASREIEETRLYQGVIDLMKPYKYPPSDEPPKKRLPGVDKVQAQCMRRLILADLLVLANNLVRIELNRRIWKNEGNELSEAVRNVLIRSMHYHPPRLLVSTNPEKAATGEASLDMEWQGRTDWKTAADDVTAIVSEVWMSLLDCQELRCLPASEQSGQTIVELVAELWKISAAEFKAQQMAQKDKEENEECK